MSAAPQATLLPDGQRLHLHHGPIDLIIGVEGPERQTCFAAAEQRFRTILTGLVAELNDLRLPHDPARQFKDQTARRMQAAIAPFSKVFVTPMAAVAGAVADEVLAAMLATARPEKAYVNNGGDIAFHLAAGQTLNLQSATGPITINRTSGAGGVATSGWRGRSHSLGIADAVTVVAQSAATADVAATLITNAVNLPGHPAITRQPASDLSPDSDLGNRHVTVGVGPLTTPEVQTALDNGVAFATRTCKIAAIHQVALTLNGETRHVAPHTEGLFAHA